jgi:hypothetical protein
MLFDSYILAAVEQAVRDEIIYTRETKDDILETILDNITGDQLKQSLTSIISLCIDRCVISLSRQAAIFSKTKDELAQEINKSNANRTESVRLIDQVTNPDDLSFSRKTYLPKFVSQIRTDSILIDDYISTFIKSHLSADDRELTERMNALSKFLSVELADKFSPDLALELIRLSVSATMCFFVNEVSYNNEEVIQATKDVIKTNKMRKSAMNHINGLAGEANE